MDPNIGDFPGFGGLDFSGQIYNPDKDLTSGRWLVDRSMYVQRKVGVMGWVLMISVIALCDSVVCRVCCNQIYLFIQIWMMYSYIYIYKIICTHDYVIALQL